MAMSKHDGLALLGTHLFDDPIGARSDLCDGLAIGAGAIPDRPAGNRFADGRRRYALVVAVVPFVKIIIDHGLVSKTSEFAGSLRALHRAAKHEREIDAREQRSCGARLVFAFWQ